MDKPGQRFTLGIRIGQCDGTDPQPHDAYEQSREARTEMKKCVCHGRHRARTMHSAIEKTPSSDVVVLSRCALHQRYFLNVPAVTATLSAKSVANGNTTKPGLRLNGSER